MAHDILYWPPSSTTTISSRCTCTHLCGHYNQEEVAQVGFMEATQITTPVAATKMAAGISVA